ncbi:unnamed protein product [Microthlaspi erraticum]|uniref:Uncharacterized protein n=1 Tax=Microthlaspi erraticum TaxID=1685480 RepID=A0A6D2K103_9BRAS|nr:unnamed protein product [Microthlaspi erraticum]
MLLRKMISIKMSVSQYQEMTVRRLLMMLVMSNDNEENYDSGDDVWNDDTIPDPLSSDDEEEEAERESHVDTIPPDEILALGKTFGCAYEFKQALLRCDKSFFDIRVVGNFILFNSAI